MEIFNETIIKMFRDKVQFEELKDCKVYQAIDEYYRIVYTSDNDELHFRVSHNYQVLKPVTKDCELLMKEFNEKLFRDKAKIELLENCTIHRCKNRTYHLIIQSDSEESLKILWKNYRLLTKAARECGFFGYLTFKKGNGNYYGPPCEINAPYEIEKLDDY